MEKDMSLHEAHMQIEYLEKMLAHAVKAIPHKCFTCRNGYHSDNGFDCDQTHYKSGNPDCLSWDWAGIATAEETAADLNGLNVCNIWKVVASFRRGCIEPLPCKVGDTVYELRGDTEEDIVEAVIKRIECDKYGWKIWVTPADYNQTHQVRVRLQDYDKRFFSFREDAVDEIYWKKETKSMKNPNIEFCKKGISVVTENANGEA